MAERAKGESDDLEIFCEVGGRISVVEYDLPKVEMWVRFPSPADAGRVSKRTP